MNLIIIMLKSFLNFEFTEKLGEMVRVEKIIMTDNIIKGKTSKTIKGQ